MNLDLDHLVFQIGNMAKLKKRCKIPWIIVISLSLVLTNFSHGQEVTLPDTPAGRMARAYFEAFGKSDAEMRELIANTRTTESLERVPLDHRMTQFRQVKGMLQTLDLKKIIESTSHKLVVLVFSQATGAWFEAGFTLTDDTPPKLTNFALTPTSAPHRAAKDTLEEWKDLTALLEIFIEKNGIPGVSMTVIKDGRIKENAVAGVRKLGSTDAIEANDRFHIGSVTKSMTATLIGKLVEEGKLEESATLKTLFPKINMLPVYESVTVHQLLTHTAGVPSYSLISDELGEELNALPGNSMAQRLAFIQRVLNEPSLSTPGSSFNYSNAGYAILGSISEKISGLSWEKQMEKVLFEPLEMSTAGMGWPKDVDNGNQPVGHYNKAGKYDPHDDLTYDIGAYTYIDPAGNVHASMENLARYALLHIDGLNGKKGILKPETVQWLHTVPENRNYAAGWFVDKVEGERVHWHSGSAGTFMTLILFYPDTNEGYVLAANAGGFIVERILKEIVSTYRAR